MGLGWGAGGLWGARARPGCWAVNKAEVCLLPPPSAAAVARGCRDPGVLRRSHFPVHKVSNHMVFILFTVKFNNHFLKTRQTWLAW